MASNKKSFIIPPYGRKETFNLVQDIILSSLYNNPVIVEIGMTRAIGEWQGDGYSTPFFAYLINVMNGNLFSIDISENAKRTCEHILSKYGLLTDRVNLIIEDALSFLRRWSNDVEIPIDLLYLDAWDYREGEAAKISEESHLEAFKIIENSLSERVLILIDDIHDTESFKGKGRLVIPYLLNKGYKILYLGYQCLLSKKEARMERLSKSAIPFLEDLDSQKAFEYFKEAVTFQGRGQIDEAIMLYQKAIEIKPDYDMAYYNLGNIFREKGNSNDAESCYQKTLQINPNHEWAHFNLGIISKEKGQLTKAIDHYRKTLQLNPNIEEAHFNLGIIFQEKGQLDESIACNYNALQLHPYYAEAYLNLGKALEDKDLIDEALICYQKAKKIKPTLFAKILPLNIMLALFC